MDITGIAKSHHVDIPKASSKKEWKLSDSLREQIAGYAREDAAQGVYMGNKFLALRKNEVAKVAPDRAALMGKVDMKTIREADRRWQMEMLRCPACKGRICDIIATAGGRVVLKVRCLECGRIVKLEWLLQVTETAK